MAGEAVSLLEEPQSKNSTPEEETQRSRDDFTSSRRHFSLALSHFPVLSRVLATLCYSGRRMRQMAEEACVHCKCMKNF
ncbi:hypothetical protein B9Z55_006980 [Caenorhabditis nigoni]|uniref:Uncharacterized protein n=1 Tax=Caenorhabditis nigoni TaxID=1611254 RepID=A0A2G5V7J2_9PELO|nr:hypothetical protein B9Z55_006980 [Caenorhabditis nigoni]